MNFSQRMGITPKKAIQVESMDIDLRNSLWNVLSVNILNNRDNDWIRGSNLEKFFKVLWMHYFKEPMDDIPDEYEGGTGGLKILRTYILKSEWFNVYDFFEFIIEILPDPTLQKFIDNCNNFCKKENSAYRIINGKFVPISSEEEVQEIERALSNTEPYASAREHLSESISLMSNKQNPGYRNSIKESISAIESLCKILVNEDKVTLSKALKKLKEDIGLHPGLEKAFSSLYGYASDAKGIRHNLKEGEEDDLTSADARFILIICSAFINYVIALKADSPQG